MKSPLPSNSIPRVCRSNLANLTLLAVLIGAQAGWAATVSDNFDDGNDTAGPIIWQRYDPIAEATGGAVKLGTWSFPGGNSYRLQTAPSPDPGTYGQARIGSLAPGNFTNFYVAVDIVNWDDTIHQLFGVLARAGNVGPGSTSGYLFSYDRGDPTSSTSGDMDIVRLDNEEPTDLDGKTYFGTDSVHLETGHSYRFVFMGMGDTFRGQVYDQTNTTVPIVDYGATDPLYDPSASDHVSGMTGVIVANNAASADGPADATFDNFLATDGQLLSANFPLLSLKMQSSSTVRVSWPGVGNGATHVLTTNLQSSPSLTSPAWRRSVPASRRLASKTFTRSHRQSARSSSNWFCLDSKAMKCQRLVKRGCKQVKFRAEPSMFKVYY